jgi:leucyl/phenylalanyl-tRNA--protein transferase
MAILEFPPVETASPDGVLAMGGDLEVPSLLLAYSQGIFPWPHDGYPLLWFSPPQRMILEFSDLHIPHRLTRDLKKNIFSFAVDQNFSGVIRNCAEGIKRKERETWITDEVIAAYTELHRQGYAHSFEAYHDEELVGGLYGVSLGAMFCAESMFYLKSGASKAALLYAVNFLKAHGATWLDVQMPSPLLKILGAQEVERSLFLEKLREALNHESMFGR